MGLYNKFKQRNALKEKIGKELMPVACIQQDWVDLVGLGRRQKRNRSNFY